MALSVHSIFLVLQLNEYVSFIEYNVYQSIILYVIIYFNLKCLKIYYVLLNTIISLLMTIIVSIVYELPCEMLK